LDVYSLLEREAMRKGSELFRKLFKDRKRLKLMVNIHSYAYFPREVPQMGEV